jgi:hypothetical protein
VTAADRYATPTAFRRALTDRLKSLTATSRWTMPQLQRHVASADIADWFRFEVGAATPVGIVGVRLPVTSVIGTTTWAGFHVDLIGAGLRMTSGYAAEARRSLLPPGRTLDEALNLVRLFIDPLLDQSATGHWDPGSRQWAEA